MALLALVLLIAAAVALALWLATRAVGPSYHDGAYTVDAGAGLTRVDRINTAGAQAFQAKLLPPSSLAGLARLQARGVDFTEEEVNAELAQQLALQPAAQGGFTVDRIFLELHPVGSRVYVYGHLRGQALTLSSHVAFSVVGTTGLARLSDAQIGRLPLGSVWLRLLDWTGNRNAVEQRLALTLPPQISDVQTDEGTLHAAVQLQRTAERLGGVQALPFGGPFSDAVSLPAPGNSITVSALVAGCASASRPACFVLMRSSSCSVSCGAGFA